MPLPGRNKTRKTENQKTLCVEPGKGANIATGHYRQEDRPKQDLSADTCGRPRCPTPFASDALRRHVPASPRTAKQLQEDRRLAWSSSNKPRRMRPRTLAERRREKTRALQALALARRKSQQGEGCAPLPRRLTMQIVITMHVTPAAPRRRSYQNIQKQMQDVSSRIQETVMQTGGEDAWSASCPCTCLAACAFALSKDCSAK